MKKLLLVAAMMLVSMSYASAAWKTYYVQEQEGQEYPSQSFFKIDWEGKYFFLDSDSEDETKCPIKNFSESGNKKSFSVYYTQSVGGMLYCKVEFITVEESKFKLTQIFKGDGGKTMKMTYILSDKKSAKDAVGDARKNPKEAIKDGLGKVKDIFKKKDKDEEKKK